MSHTWASAWILASLMIVPLCGGCSKSADEDQVGQRKYEVADERGDETGGSQTSPADSGTSTASPPAAGASGQPAPPQPPSLSGAELSGGEQVQVPDGTPEELLAFVQQLQQQVNQLGETRPAQGTVNAVLARITALCEAEVEAADKILATNPAPPLRKQAIDARLHGMRFLTMVAPTPERLQDLRSFVQSLATDDDPELSLQGRVILFGLRVGDLRQKPNPDVPGLMNELKALLANERRGADVQNVTLQAYMTLQNLGYDQQADEAFRMIAEAFKDHPDPELAQEAANMFQELEIRKIDLEGKLGAVARKEPDATEPFLAALKQVLGVPDPGPSAAQEALKALAALEQSGQYALGIEVGQLIRATFEQSADEQLRQGVGDAVDMAMKRLQLVGQPLVVEGTKLDGTPLDFSKYQGKVVLVDFWATWCGPCVAELPNMRDNYKLYHDAGFEIIGVNLDQDRDAVVRFLESESLPWATIVNNELAKRCGVESIPFMILLDRNGVVVDLHVRGDALGRKLAQLLGPAPAKPPAAPAAPPADGTSQSRLMIPARPATGVFAAVRVEKSNPAGPVTGPRGRAALVSTACRSWDDRSASQDAEVGRDAGAERSASAAAEQPRAALELPDVDEDANPYLAPADLNPMELVVFLLDMQEKPQSIRRRPGFSAAVVDAADRVLAADAKDRYRIVAALAKFAVLHADACRGDRAADEALWAFVQEVGDEGRPELASQVAFFRLERRAMQSDDLPVDKIAPLLADLKTHFAGQKELTARHLRLASETVRTINRLDDETQREAHFSDFGELFSKSDDKQLARYGKKLSGGKAGAAELVGKPLELAGETAMGTLLNWGAYRGKVVLVDFWATWCGPCRRELPHLKLLVDELEGEAFDVVGVNLDADVEALGEYLDDHQITWENLVGPSAQQVATRYGIRGIPTMILVDADGKTIQVSHKVADLRPRITELLSSG